MDVQVVFFLRRLVNTVYRHQKKKKETQTLVKNIFFICINKKTSFLTEKLCFPLKKKWWIWELRRKKLEFNSFKKYATYVWI